MKPSKLSVDFKITNKALFAVVSFVILSTITNAQPKANSLFWQITGEKLKDTSYLYGTMHLSDQRIFNFRDGVLESLEKADAFVMELNVDSLMGNMALLMQHMLMDSSISLTDLLTTEGYDKVNDYFEDSLGMPLVFFNRVLPIFTSTMVNQSSFKSDASEALDLYLYKKAVKQQKEIIGLETVNDQMRFFRKIPYKIQAESLLKSIDQIQEVDTLANYMLKCYIEEDLDKILELTTGDYDMGFEEFKDDFEKYLIVDRNLSMSLKMDEIISSKSAFIAVGAAHLPGTKGILELLRAKGYIIIAK